MRSIKGQLLVWQPRNTFLYRVCKRYVDRYNSENNDNIYTNGEWRFMKTILPQCAIVFDVGANIGDWTKLALSINPTLQIHCFEPSAVTFQRLQSCHFEGAVTLNNVGLSSIAGKQRLWVYFDGSGENSLYKRRGLEEGWGLMEQEQSEEVMLDTIDEYCKRRGVQVIDFIKIDVEGHELEVLKGAVIMLELGKIKRIQFEYGGCNIDSRLFLKDLFDYLMPYNYSFYKIFPKELRHVSRYDQRLENFQYQNWLVCKN